MAYKPRILSLSDGGTNASLTASNGGILYSTASAVSVLAGTATAGQILRSGASAVPSWSTATYPSTAGTAGKVLISDGTNIVSSTPTFPNASATAGKFIRSDGTNWIASTPTLPTTAGTSANLLTSDGTNWLSSAPAGLGASLVLIQTQTASTSATLDFTGLSTYTNLYVVINSIQPVTNTANFQMLVSQNNGSTWVGAGNYSSGVNTHAYNSTTVTNINSANDFRLSGPINNAQSMWATLNIFNLNIANIITVLGQSFYNDTTIGTVATAQIGGWGTTGVNALRFQMSSGNISSGTISIYGIRTS